MFLKRVKARNYEERAKGKLPYIILLHYTGMETMEEAKERLSEPENEVSAHYLIDEDGTVYDLVPEDKRAWHAGVSYWKRESDINSVSIGIEIVNPGHEFGYCAFPEEQIYAVKCLCQEIQSRHDIKYVLGHSDVAPERKVDPGELMDWQYLTYEGVGVLPDLIPEDYEKARELARNDFEAKKMFDAFGYNPMAAHIDVVTAFQRHYYPQVFLKGEEGKSGEACEETMARLVALVRQSKK
ncbi:MAG: N-acetylmuramoyl-L-alanine amidase [Alphaproteobacteria bacterium]|nr:N-acetylmuramoyl-L-alanine amidase [Alphaproteobacteria bacterium]